MKKVEDIIYSLTKKEAKNFVLFASRMRTNAKKSKIIQLFEAYYSKKYKNNDEIMHALFPNMSKNTFYRLRNRLLDEVQQSLLVQYNRMDEQLTIHRLIMLAKIAFNKNDFNSTHTLLLDAEKKALKIEAYELVMIVYKELISLSSLFSTVNSGYYIEKRREIRLKHEKISELRYLCEKVTFQLTESIHKEKTEAAILKSLEEIKDKLAQSNLVNTSFDARYNVMFAIVNILYENNEYELLRQHLIKIYDEFTAKNLFDKTNHRKKIVILSWIIATHHWLLRIPQSIPYLKKMDHALQQYEGFQEKFSPFYTTYQNSIYYHTNQLEKSLQTLQKFTLDYLQGRNIIYLAELPQSVLSGHFGRLAQVYFSKQQYDTALKQLAPCYLSEIHDKLPQEFHMEIAIFEVITHTEKGDKKYALNQLRRLKRLYKKHLDKPKNALFKSFVNILNTIVKNGHFDFNKTQRQQIQAFLEQHPPYGLPFEKCICYKVWLESKIQKKPYYQLVTQYAQQGAKKAQKSSLEMP